MRRALARFVALRDAPRELWLVYALKMLESFAYFSMSLNLVLYLTREFGYSDLAAGSIYGAWGVATSVFGMLCGPLIDKMGVRNSLVVGGMVTCLGRALFAGSSRKLNALISLLVLQPAGMCMAIPVLAIAIRRVCDERNRTAAYGVFYSCMNVAALVSGLGTDAFNAYLRRNYGLNGSMRALFWTGTACTLLYTCIAGACFRPLHPTLPQDDHVSDEDEDDDDVVDDVAQEDAGGDIEMQQAPQVMPEPRDKEAVKATCFAKKRPQIAQGALGVAKEIWADRVFWRLVAFSASLLGARTIFRHMDATLPKWMQRTIGEHAAYGSVYAINPAIIIVIVPPLQAFLAEHDAYTCIAVGASISVASPFVLAILEPSYAAAALFMVVLSLGEAVYSPRLYEYMLLLAPEGREGVYSALASAPLFVVTLIVGAVSGGLLGAFCPRDPPRSCKLMWAFIGLVALTTPVLLTVLRPCLHSQDVRDRLRASRRIATVRSTQARSRRPNKPESKLLPREAASAAPEARRSRSRTRRR